LNDLRPVAGTLWETGRHGPRVRRDAMLDRRSVLAPLAAIAAIAAAAPAHATTPGANGALVFTSNRAGQADLYMKHERGSDLMRLTYARAVDSAPAVSPDGSRVAFVSTRDGQAELYLLDTAWTRAVRLTRDPAADVDPAWSPDGRYLAFSSNRGGIYAI